MKVVVQKAADGVNGVEIPTRSDFERWGVAAIAAARNSRVTPEKHVPEICVRVVGVGESAELNRRYLGRSGPTNVLAFPFDAPLPPDVETPPLGDVVIAASMVESEAREQGKLIMDHWTHLFVHAVLHLQGYDHVEEEDARRMEALERDILKGLGIADPYRGKSATR